MRTGNFSKVLRIVVTVWAPYTNPCSNADPPTLVPTKACPKPGHSNQILAYLLEQAGIQYELVRQPDPLDWGAPTRPEGPDFCDYWSGVLGELQNGTLDMITCLYSASVVRQKCFGFTSPIITEPNVIIYKDAVVVGDSLGALFRVYTNGVWILALGIILLTSLFLTITASAFAWEEEERSRHFLSHLSEAFWTCIQFASDQLSSIPKTEAMRTHTARWILSFLGLFALFLLRLYENGLLAELITTNKVTPFRSTAELAEKMVAGKAEWAYVADTVFDSLLLDPRITAMNAMREVSAVLLPNSKLPMT